MFSAFFYLLRARGIDVSLNEWMTLMEALNGGLANSSLTEFYYLSRAILVKTESEFDTFDGAFLEFFENTKAAISLPEGIGILKGLNTDEINIDEMMDAEAIDLSDEEILKMLQNEPNEQTLEHNSSSQMVGAGGASFVGHNGNNAQGVRLGGSSKNKAAFEVAGERSFRDFRNDKILKLEQYQTAFKRLRQFSARIDAPKTELDLNETINETCDHAGILNIVYQRPRQNTVKVLLLMDSGGSMRYYTDICNSLFHAVSKANHFKDLKIFFFHNCIYTKLYTDPACRRGYWVETEWVLNNIKSDYKVIFVGDAAMNPAELFETSYYRNGLRNDIPGIDWLRRFSKKYKKIVWLNPEEIRYRAHDYTQETRKFLENEFDMYPLTISNLERALKKLISAK